MIRFVTFLLIVIVSSLSLAKADETLSSMGLKCTSLEETLSNYQSKGLPLSIKNLKDGSSFWIIASNIKTNKKHNTFLYRPSFVDEKDYCDFKEVKFQFPDIAFYRNDYKPSKYERFYKETLYPFEGKPEVITLNYDEEFNLLSYIRGKPRSNYSGNSIWQYNAFWEQDVLYEWRFDSQKAEFILLKFIDRNTGERIDGLSYYAKSNALGLSSDLPQSYLPRFITGKNICVLCSVGEDTGLSETQKHRNWFKRTWKESVSEKQKQVNKFKKEK